MLRVIKQRPIRREVGTQTDRAIHDIIAENETLSNKLNKIENIGTLVNRTNTAHSSKAVSPTLASTSGVTWSCV